MPDQPTDKKAPPEKRAAGNNKVINRAAKVGNNGDAHPDAGAIPLDELAKDEAPLNELEQKISSALITLDTKLQDAQPVIQVRCGEHLTTFATLKNFSLIIGKAKSKKTFFVVLLLAGFFRSRPLSDKIYTQFFEGKTRIIVFDTEQADFHVQRMLKRIVATAGINKKPDSLDVYCLRPFSTKERLQIIEYIIYNTPGIAVIVIDGIRDLITDINSAEEATMITGLLMKWTHERSIHILTILHQNKGDIHARGHAGAELTNKAESVLSIALDQQNKELSIVKPEFFRDKDFEPFAFSVDETGLPFIVDTWEPSPTSQQFGEPVSQRNKKDYSFESIPAEIHCRILKTAFTMETAPTYGKGWENLQAAFESEKRKIPDNIAKGFFKQYILKGWVKPKEEKGYTKYSIGELP